MSARDARRVFAHWYRYMPPAMIALVVLWLAHSEWKSPHATDAQPGRSTQQRAVLNIAHRGASGLAPEHTLAGYDLAVELGADYIEQDLQLTKDGVLVVLHDATLDRTARGPSGNCTGRVIEKTLAQLRTCDVGSWFNAAYPAHARAEFIGLRIPTLDEVFARYQRRTRYYIETKNPESAPGMEERLLQQLDAHGLRLSASTDWIVLIQSFSAASLRKLHELDASLPLVQLYGSRLDSSATIRATLDSVASYAVGIGPSASMVDSALGAAARAHCLELHPYTVNDTVTMRVLVAAGATGMFTNFPDRLAALRDSAAKRETTAVRNVSNQCELQRRTPAGR